MVEKENIAYSPESNLFILIPSFLSIIMNGIFIFHYILIINSNKNIKMTSIHKLLLSLSVLESIISLLWFLSGIIFDNDQKIIDNEQKCKIFGALTTFVYIFDWILVYFTISHLKNMILNPINYILKSKKKILKYLLISGIIALALSNASYFLKIVGKSPMLTCFLSLDNYFENDKKAKEIIGLVVLSIICTLPIINLIFGIIQIIIVCVNDSFRNDIENRKIFLEHILYLMINFIIAFILPNLYIIEFFKDNKKKKTFTKNYIFACSLIICATPLFVGGIRLYKTKIIKSIIKKIKKKIRKKKNDRESSISLNIEASFEQFESAAIEKFVMNIYIAICFCLEKKIEEPQINYEDLGESSNNETIRYKISKKAIFKQLQNGLLINDRLVKLREEFSISCVEFAPKIFKFLRKIDGVSEESIVNSMLPMNNKTGINETEGRGGSFFVNSDDREFIIKTITFEEMELMRKLLLKKMAKHFYENSDSIICRIYRVYKISMHTGIFEDDEIYFILMKNVFGAFCDNLICKYDLKGSSLNRKTKYENIDKKVMKDLNFNEVEEVFLINKNNSQKLINIVEKDANFLCSLGIMDYSLLVGKITLNKDESILLFGKEHRKNSEKDYLNMINLERQTVSIKSEEKEKEKDDAKIDVDENVNNYNGIRFKDSKIDSLRKYFFPSLKWDILYIMSIIDFFQLYNLQKNFETKYKQIANRIQAKYISSVPPEKYKERFIEFVKKKSDSEKYLKFINDPENQNDF